ncbi:uncharacterized protein A1O5_11161 [Cladophialophora psammophila CBS 110553]|uniref:Uncharacterized protein n=1 Tax=Cladophialophora psammophila CBS 110553 TaxID=1182543 RepID=W9X597_9EURO|nr:uncharacterized protein A1O5_11161 [Cladophialophora psammophila CBS 110553]EXJ65634.1 hypothetical protein A1O5_11161 [Cladophialophora psammophila CBS 110553]
MAARVSAVYNVPYDPREWVGGSRRTSFGSDGRNTGAQAEEGLSNPPPPYSAAAAAAAVAAAAGVNVREATSAGSTISPADSTFTAPGNQSQLDTPTSTVGVLSPLNQGSNYLADSGQTITDTNGLKYFSPPGRPGGFDHRPGPLSISSQQNGSRPGSAMGMSRHPLGTTLSINTVAAQQSMPLPPQTDANLGSVPAPPGSRRAASADACSSHPSSIQSREGSTSRSSSKQRSWYPGLPLPGPPPGPPPSALRSQSAGGGLTLGQPQAAGTSSSRPHHRIPIHAPLLSPMPPTPANWRDESTHRSSSRTPMPLHIETTNLDRPGSTPAGLTRSAAVRVSSAKGLLERRKQRRSLHEGQLADLSALTIDTDPWFNSLSPTGISPEQSPILGPLAPGRASPETARKGLRTSSRTRSRFHGNDSEYQALDSPYPPALSRRSSRTPLVPPKALPTPPLSQKNPTSAHSILPSAASSVSELSQVEYDSFMQEALRRHQQFLIKENQANTELERLQIFVEYVVEESKIRRQHYPSPFADGSFNPEEAKQRLFTDSRTTAPVEVRATTPGRMRSPMHGMRADPSQHTDMWSKEYRPELSPIASMSNDELSSRGRTASRWWQSQTGSETDGAPKKMKRSKRESKYMGLSALSMQEVLSEAATPTNINEVHSSTEGYPDEKVNPGSFGIYDDLEPPPVQETTPPNPLTPVGLDISRFITLPPPYPRHHPAVNNSHPKLATYRRLVRTLSDLSELQSRRSRHNLSVEALRTEHKRKIAEGQKNFKTNISAQINEGSITFAEAAEAEQALKMEENMAEKACLQAEFDTLQDVVINPMHEMLHDRATQLNAHMTALTQQLVADMQASDLDRPQQEGDAMPEILEYLTQLKWLFETRETVHKEIFNLLTERNDKYKAIVLLPYHQVSNFEKIRDTEDFFNRDSVERHKAFCEEALLRYQSFVDLVAEHVQGEVELQSSAFWDIAPGLLDLIQKIPDNMDQLGAIVIPDAEYEENPVYRQFPQQYLFTLLDHAEKSTYQFIESQSNLNCLFHEVKVSLIAARCRATEARRARAELDGPVAGEDPVQVRDEQEKAATAELKQQVAMIEEQWLEALGSALQSKKGRVKMFLESVGGWDDSIQGGE